MFCPVPWRQPSAPMDDDDDDYNYGLQTPVKNTVVDAPETVPEDATPDTVATTVEKPTAPIVDNNDDVDDGDSNDDSVSASPVLPKTLQFDEKASTEAAAIDHDNDVEESSSVESKKETLHWILTYPYKLILVLAVYVALMVYHGRGDELTAPFVAFGNTMKASMKRDAEMFRARRDKWMASKKEPAHPAIEEDL